MRLQEFDEYMKHAQEISRKVERDQGGLRELLRLIERTKDQAGSEKHIQEFFTAEYAFYDEQYERALPHYLQAKGISYFEFFCFRVSAYIAKARGDNEKALKFVKRALEVFPDDHYCLVLLNNILPNPTFSPPDLALIVEDQPKRLDEPLLESALVVPKEIVEEELSPNFSVKLHDKENKPSTKIIGEKEIEDLAGFFRF